MNAYDILETHSRDNNFCRLILNFMVNHPLEKYTKVRLLNIEHALKELNEIAKQLTDLTQLLQKMESDNDKQFEFDSVLKMFMIHIASIFARNMVQILICLSFTIEPHIYFWENQHKLNNKKNKYKLYRNLTKIYTLSISSRRARIFKKLLSDLYIQIGHIQWWFWGLIKLKNSANDNDNNDNNNNNIIQFISEMNDLFDNKNNNKNNKNIIDCMIETISFADSFTIKMQKDIKIWGMPSHWRQNYKIYSFCTISIVFTSLFSYYNWSKIKSITNSSLNIAKNFFIRHLYDPIMDEMFTEIFFNKKREMENEYEIEKEILSNMIQTFESKSKSNININEEYFNDIETPIMSATKGSLLTNIFIQIQKMKVDVSKLLIDVHNKYNMNIYPFIAVCAFYLFEFRRMYSNKSGNNKLKTESINKLRFIFRSIYSILIKNYDQEYIPYEQCGLMLFLMYKCYFWAQNNLKNKLLSNDEYQWLKFDINHFISQEFSVQQRLSLIKRMETYYL